ncbi:MAG: RNA methyltransferase [Actinomycetota bacterium]|nr:RNA methyltransferase [Actinomycetota bacterium]
MAQLTSVDDPDDPRLADYRDLRDASLRTRLETEHGLFIAEGEKVVRRALQAGYRARSFLMTNRWLEGLAPELDNAAEVPCYVVSLEVAEAVTGFHVHRGALASLLRRPLPTVAEVLAGARRVALLEDIVDHTNVGAIFRCAAALGVDALLLSPRCADPFYRRSIKVAMGAVFSLPWTRLDDWYDAMPRLAEEGFITVAMTLAEGAENLTELAPEIGTERICIVLGSEGPGLSSRWMTSAEHRATIPLDRGVDSLNVGTASALAFFLTRAAAPVMEGSSAAARGG